MRSLHAFTLIELMIVLVILAVTVALVSTRFDDWQDAEAVKSASRTVEGALGYARGEAIRTGHYVLIFFQSDMAGANLLDEAGDQVPILVLDDGLPGSANQNCDIDAGEPIQAVRIERGVRFGPTAATARVPIDEGPAAFGGAFTFDDRAGGAANWLLFRPDGTSRGVSTACAQGSLGTGGGAVYLSNAERDVAVVVTPLGVPRVFAWTGSAWK